MQEASERVTEYFEKSWTAIAVILNDASLALEPQTVVTSRFRPIGLDQDSKSVLRETARLRL